jgi:predicted dehydrogenase
MKDIGGAIECVLVGAGARGADAYGKWALEHPDRLKFIAVAEPDAGRRQRFAEDHKLAPDSCYSSFDELFQAGKLAQALVCATQDQMHVQPTLAALELGYHVLLEKPMALNPTDCVTLIEAAEKSKRLLMISHVLRYTPFFSAIQKVIKSGRLGDIVAVEQRENLAYWHMAHSYVRGNWSNSDKSSPMILAKCCHDLDVLSWIIDRPVKRVQSFGSLMHFASVNAPAGATARCTDGCPVAESCPFDAQRLYLNMENTGWPVSTLSTDISYKGRLKALQEGPYGRCVYHCDNNVVDHQVVNLEHEGGAITTLVMQGHSHEEGRTIRYDGTKATLRAKFTYNTPSEIRLYDHLSNDLAGELIPIPSIEDSGHGGGDAGLSAAFVEAVGNPSRQVLSSARASLMSHLLAFAAEEARVTGNTIAMADYLQSTKLSISR